MEKQTLKFSSLMELAQFARTVSTGYLMNTNNFTLTGKFTDEEISRAVQMYHANKIVTTEKVFSYGTLG
jgi:hypothetical protein